MKRILHVAALLTAAGAAYFAWTGSTFAQARPQGQRQTARQRPVGGNRIRMGRVPDSLHGLPRQRRCPRGAVARADSPDDAGTYLCIADHRLDENSGRRVERRSASHAGDVYVGAPARQPGRRLGAEHAESLRGESCDDRSGFRTRVERMGRGHEQRALPVGQECRTDRGSSSESEAQVGLRRADGHVGYNQPTIVSGRVFLGTDTGYVYSLDAKTGCVYWSFQTKAAVRGALSVGPVKGKGSTKYGVFFGDFRTYVYGLDAQTGQQIWSTRADDHFIARITAAPHLSRREGVCARIVVGGISGGESGLRVLAQVKNAPLLHVGQEFWRY